MPSADVQTRRWLRPLVGLLTFGDAKKGLQFVIGDVLRSILMELALDGPVVAISRPCNQINTDLWALQAKFISHLLWNIWCGARPRKAWSQRSGRTADAAESTLQRPDPFTTF